MHLQLYYYNFLKQLYSIKCTWYGIECYNRFINDSNTQVLSSLIEPSHACSLANFCLIPVKCQLYTTICTNDSNHLLLFFTFHFARDLINRYGAAQACGTLLSCIRTCTLGSSLAECLHQNAYIS